MAFNETSTQSSCITLVTEIEHMNRVNPSIETYFKIGYLVLIIVGIINNLLVIAAVARSTQLRIGLNACIVQLACSDLCVCLFTAPSTLYLFLRTFWPFGQFACRMIATTQAINTFVSSFTLAAIGISRYASLSPESLRRQMLTCCLLGVWIGSVALASPYYFALQTRDFAEHGSPSRNFIESCDLEMPQFCIEVWRHSDIYTSCVFALQYAAPLIALVASYYGIGQVLQTRRRAMARMQVRNGSDGQLAKRQRRSFILMCSLCGCFAVCSLPNNLYHILVLTKICKYNAMMKLTCIFVSNLQVVINPLLYGAFNENFRRVYMHMLKEVIKCRIIALNDVPPAVNVNARRDVKRSRMIIYQHNSDNEPPLFRVPSYHNSAVIHKPQSIEDKQPEESSRLLKPGNVWNGKRRSSESNSCLDENTGQVIIVHVNNSAHYRHREEGSL